MRGPALALLAALRLAAGGPDPEEAGVVGARGRLEELEPDFTLRMDDEVEEPDGLLELEGEAEDEALVEADARSDEGWVPGVDKIAVTNCHMPVAEGGNKCPTGETCVVKYDQTWSQCVDCTPEAFGNECQKLEDYMRYAAVNTCKQSCLNSKCYNKDWCPSPRDRCIIDRNTKWGQCVNCRDKKFWSFSCKGMTRSFMASATKVCRKHCPKK